jgi:hypothetical protein
MIDTKKLILHVSAGTGSALFEHQDVAFLLVPDMVVLNVCTFVLLEGEITIKHCYYYFMYSNFLIMRIMRGELP